MNPVTEDPSIERSIEIKRVFNAPRQLVWNAWTQPELIAEWWSPNGMHAPLDSVTCELRVGGAFSVKMIMDEDGTEHDVDAKFESLDEPNQLVLVNAQPGDPFKFVVTLDELGDDKTELTLFCIGDATAQEVAEMDQGWSEMFDKQDRLLAQ